MRPYYFLLMRIYTHLLLTLNNFNELLHSKFCICKNLRTYVEDKGFEPLTPCVQGRCSSQLS